MDSNSTHNSPELDSVRWDLLLKSFETKMRWFAEVGAQTNTSTIHEEELLKQVMLSIMGNFGCSSSVLFRCNPQTRQIRRMRQYGVDENTAHKLSGLLEQCELGKRREYVFALDQIAEDDPLRMCLPLSFSFILHLPIDHTDHALILLGSRLNGSQMTSEELSIITAMISHMTITLQYHRLVDQSFLLRAEVFRTRGLLEQFVAPEIVNEMLSKDNRISTKGERKMLTILSADIRGFTAVCEQNEPEMIVAALNAFYAAMSTIIFQNNGMVDKFIGDAVMAVFGTPVSKEDDTVHAVRSAIQMQEQFELLKKDHPEFSQVFALSGIGIGIATGQVVVGHFGSGRRMDYTAVGRKVNLSARLCTIARIGEILADDETSVLVGKTYNIKPLRPMSLKGIGDFVEVFKVDYNGQQKNKLSD